MLYLIPTAKAAATVDVAAFGNALNPIITNVIDPLVALMFSVALIVFVYGIVQMIIHGAEADEYKRGKWSMVYGLIGMFIMVSAWGIVNVIANTVNGFW